MIGRTHRAPALLFRTANLEIWQARYTWVFFRFCVYSYEEPENTDCKGRTRFERDGRLFVSAESVTGLDEENSELPYCSFLLTVVSTVSDG